MEKKSKELLYEEFKRHYYDFVIGVNQSRVVSKVSQDAMKEFPARLPEDIQKQVKRFLADFLRDIQDEIESKDFQGFELFAEETLDALVFLNIAYISAGYAPTKADFDMLCEAQQLIMIFSHFDAYLNNVVRVLCSLNPEVLKEKSIKLSMVLEGRSTDEIFDSSVDKFVREITGGNVVNRIKAITGKFGLEVKFPENEYVNIHNASMQRNVWVHNGGLANDNFLENVKYPPLYKLGDRVPVDPLYVTHIESRLVDLAGLIFSVIHGKHFSNFEKPFIWINSFEIPEEYDISEWFKDNPVR